jgi:hypothetical protein
MIFFLAWYDRFLQDLKNKCLAPKPAGNATFWKQVEEVGRPLSLISDKEAKKHGGTSQYTEKQANEVCCVPFVLFASDHRLIRVRQFIGA